MPDKQLKQLAMQARFYRLTALIFTFTGFLILVLLFIQNIDGRLFSAMTEPITLTFLVSPFVPAIILAWLAKDAEKKYFSLLEK